MDGNPVLDGSRIALRLVALAVACTAFILGEWFGGVVLAAIFLFVDQLVAAFVALRHHKVDADHAN
ncbi:MAG TPA: hypothetical protein VGB18_00125 [Candidatus Thermoplasmatota archaeon]